MEESYINIGTDKACLFVAMSTRLLHGLRKFPLLYDAVEEALVSAKAGYYAIGIIVWYELLKSVLNANSRQDSLNRNSAAHDILTTHPTKEVYNDLLNKFKQESRKCYLKEIAGEQNVEQYNRKIADEWYRFIDELSKSRFVAIE